jgi:dihydrofolate reductase
MRKIIVLTFVTLDGVMQAPGGPEEDTSGGFQYGGWTVPFFDEFLGETMGAQMGQPFDLLLGRKTFEIFATYWPYQEEEGEPINRATKYVVSNTMAGHEWEPSVFIGGDVAAQLSTLKQGDGPDLQVHGSWQLIQTLLAQDLVDELWLKIFPVTLGTGKRLFGEGTMPGSYALVESVTTPAGVVVASFRRAGEVETGSF